MGEPDGDEQQELNERKLFRAWGSGKHRESNGKGH